MTSVSGPLLLIPYAEGHKENKKDMEMIILESLDTIRSDLVQTHSPTMPWVPSPSYGGEPVPLATGLEHGLHSIILLLERKINR